MMLKLFMLANAIFPSSFAQDIEPRITDSLVAHEWGTFTALQGSNGLNQLGMHHEEEALPAFVHGRDPLREARGLDCTNPKCFEDLPARVLQVSQKMETPVIYFYSPHNQKVNVTVDFPFGVISQYFPMPTSFSPEIGNVRSLSEGRVNFQVEISKSPLDIPPVVEGNVYGPAREVASDFIRSGNENEKFIFYRGLGNFSTTFKAKSKDGALSIYNTGNFKYPAVFLVYSDGNAGSIQLLGEVKSERSADISAKHLAEFKSKLLPKEEYIASAVKLLANELTRTGLFKDEALAMANTWKSSYFNTPGLRVLYVLPRVETDELLPLKIEPAPTSVVRTMVGRVEILLDTEETQLLNQVKQEGRAMNLKALGRLAEPKLRRIRQLANDPKDQAVLDDLIYRVH